MSGERYHPKHHIRVVTAASLFDGHDAAINIVRRVLQDSGAEVIHLGHNRSAGEVVDAAVQEDVQAVAVTSYQGGHIRYFKYLVDLFREKGLSHVRVFGGGGGTILPAEIKELEAYGVAKIFSPEDGRVMGFEGMIDLILEKSDFSVLEKGWFDPAALAAGDPLALARALSAVEEGRGEEALEGVRKAAAGEGRAPVVGITGTGGAGKSSLVDEIVNRFLQHSPGGKVAVLAMDPTRKRSGGALLGDRIRFNSMDPDRVFFRSMATRGAGREVTDSAVQAVELFRRAGYDLILVETSGIGQGDSAVTELADMSLYVMTSEFGAPTQLEKIEMLDQADLVAINKFDKPGSPDALKHVRKQVRRNHKAWDIPEEELPVVGTVASRFHDKGVNELYRRILGILGEKTGFEVDAPFPFETDWENQPSAALIPPDRVNYLGEIARTVREYKEKVRRSAEKVRRVQVLEEAARALGEGRGEELLREAARAREELPPEVRKALEEWPELRKQYSGKIFQARIRDKVVEYELTSRTLSGTDVPRVVLPRLEDRGEVVRYLFLEGVPGRFPFTAGVFPLKRKDEDPKRMFAGEGGPKRTNKRFHFLCRGEKAKRLSTAFDSPTLYGEDPDERPDIFGKIGESGVSICTLDDMKDLYAGFDLCDPYTSVSMTINGPAPIMLAFFFNTAIDQQVEKFRKEKGREPTPEEREEIEAYTLSVVRGTVQADILKEDQGQNTCIFAVDFALRMMGDIQEFFIEHNVRNYYSVSVSGYHIAEAGATPITQLAFTLANGFTLLEYYLGRGMAVDKFAPNFSFFFSSGMDAEYTVINRVARRIWAVALKERYGANERSQKLKSHIQTSGRSLHSQEMDFNDIRTTLQALQALCDHCNSLHTNAYDEAITTPTEESVRRAMAIQLIALKEYGLTKNENPWQGSYFFEWLTEAVEEAVLEEFERLNQRGGVLGAMELQYQRSKIQEESMDYEKLKQSGELPIIGVNTFLNPHKQGDAVVPPDKEVARATDEEKREQLERLRAFQARHAREAGPALERLKQVAVSGGNIFAELMKTTRVASLGQITKALYEVGGRYRRNM